MNESTVHELRITTLEKHFDKIDGVLDKIALDINKLSTIAIQQAEDRSALARIFSETASLNSDIKSINILITELKLSNLQEENKKQDILIKEAKTSKNMVFKEILKAISIITVTLALAKFGFKG